MANNLLLNLAPNIEILKLGVVIVILLVGFLIGKLAERAVKRLTKEIGLGRITNDLLKIKLPIETLLSRIVSWVIYFVAILFAMDQVGFGSTTLNIILIFLLGFIIILILFAIKDFIPNIIAGFVIYSKGNIKKGVKLSVNGIRGVVISVSMLETKIKTKKETIFVPNSILIKSSVMINK